MRLSCPSCNAQYEVPENAIPEGGRDVQCSNCGHTWFQRRPEVEAAAEEEAALHGDNLTGAPPASSGPEAAAAPEGSPPVETEVQAEASPEVEPTAAPEASVEAFPEGAEEPRPEDMATPEPEDVAMAGPATAEDIRDEAAPEAEGTAEEAPASPQVAGNVPEDSDAAAIAALIAETREATAEDGQPPEVQASQSSIDDSVLSILREEAEREAEARRHAAQKAENRRAEAEGQLQTQPELGVEAAAGVVMSVAQRRLAMLKGEDPQSPIPPQAKPPARRDLLPDVEEINSTLQPSEASFDPDAAVEALPDLTRGSFRSGFVLMVFLAVVAAVIYVMAPRLSAAIPGLETSLTAYVGFVDGLRGGLNRLMESATSMLSSGDG